MPRGRVLVVEADEWVTTLLTRFLSDAAYEIDTESTARGGFDRAIHTLPDLILADIVLPDIDGYWLTRRVRSDTSRLATTPIILISQHADMQARLEGLSLGADVFLAAPFRHEEVTVQVDALMGMAQRLRAKRDSVYQDSPLSSNDSALQGDVAQISIPTLLSMLEMERRTGIVRVRGEGRSRAVIELDEGAVIGAQLGRAAGDPLAVFRAVVTWTKGKYSFEPAEPKGATVPRKPTSLLLLEASRLNDEAHR